MTQFKARLAIVLVRAIGSLPLPATRWLGTGLGLLSFYFNTRMARITKKNLSICFPHLNDLERQHLTLSSLKETGKAAAETCFVWQKDAPTTRKTVHGIKGEKFVKSALDEGKGLLVLAPHLGNWEVLGSYLTTFGPVTNLYQPPKMIGFEKIIREGRLKCGSQLVPTSTKGVASLLRHLKDNGICGILPDQNPNDETSGDFAPFFGEPAFTMTLVYKLIQRTGCKAVFAFAKRTDKGFELIFRNPSDKLYSGDLHESLNALNLGIENLVREAPAQYQWEYKRFKVQNPQRPVQHYS